MFIPLLILKYLRRRKIAWVALIAVALCTAMVLVVISVMSGWLKMFQDSVRVLSGDVIVQSSLSGFPYYEQMLDEIRALPGVEHATPVINTFGLINIDNKKSEGVQVYGLRLEEMAKVTPFGGSLYRQYIQPRDIAADPKNDLTPDQRAALREQADRAFRSPSFDLPLPDDVYRDLLPGSRNDPAQFPGMIAGAGVLNIRKNAQGEIVGRGPGLYHLWAKLTVLGIDQAGQSVDMSNKGERRYWIVDDSSTGAWMYDGTAVYVPFDLLQKDLGMDARIDPANPRFSEPARTSEIHVKARPGVDLQALKADVDRIVQSTLEANGRVMPYPPLTQTWREARALFINAIEKEIVLITVLFSLISVVAIFLIFCIFYMIVAEKIKDIGIIKSVGASSWAISSIFLGYGAAIGTFGGLGGFLLGWTVVHNINFLHEQMGKLLGIQIWSPEVYAFDTIPSDINPQTATSIVSAAIVCSILGAAVPAYRAARLHPVETLRYE